MAQASSYGNEIHDANSDIIYFICTLLATCSLVLVYVVRH